MDNKWKLYIEYIKNWAEEHSDGAYAGMSPICYDEWIDNEYAGIPLYEDILDDINNLISIVRKRVKDLTDIKQIIYLHKFNPELEIEINGEPIQSFCMERYIYEQEIEWIRIDCYRSLSYIYFFADGRILFDVSTDDSLPYNLVSDISKEDLTKDNYNMWVKRYWIYQESIKG